MESERPTPKAEPGLRELLRNPNYRWLWLGQVISNFGDSLTSLALLILVNRLTGSTAALATVAILMAVPQVTLGLLAGVLVDRWDRRTTMILSDLIRALFILGLALVREPEDLWLLYLLTLLQASAGVFFTPARMALLARVVEPEELLAANSIAQTSRIVFYTLGTGVAGFVIGLWDNFALLFGLDALTFAASAWFTWRVIAPPRSKDPKAGDMGAILADLRQGLATIFASRILLGVMVASTIVMLGVGAVNVLYVPLLVNELQMPETWFGAMDASQVTGMVLGGTLTALAGNRVQPTRVVSLGLVGTGIMLATYSQVTHIWHVLALLFPTGLVSAPVHASVATLTQTAVPDALRGRTSAAMQTVVGTANITSMALAGVLADLMGVRPVFLIAGVLVVLAGLVSAFIFGPEPAVSAPAANSPPAPPS